MKQLREASKTDLVYYALVTVAYGVMLYLVGRGILVQWLWFDESGQVFVAHGLHHTSAPLSPDGSLVDALRMNHDYNLDPGGYTVLLHFWCMVSSGSVWLRSLSLIFYLGSIVFACLVSWEALRDKRLAYGAGLAVFAVIGGSFAYEVRAYSMELCGFLYGLWMVLRLRKPRRLSVVLLMSLLLCFFITSRYTMVVAGGILSCFVLYDFVAQYLRKERSLKSLIIVSVVYAIPLLVTVAAIWWFQMRLQNPGATAVGYVIYVEPGKRTYVIAAAMLFLLATLKWQTPAVRVVSLVFVALNLVVGTLGFLNMLPWMNSNNKGALFMVVFNLAIYIGGAALLQRAGVKRAIIPFLLLGYWCAEMTWISTTYRVGNVVRDKSLAPVISPVENILSNSDNLVIIGTWAGPDLRYLYEYGALRVKAKEHGYPVRFRFLRGDIHRRGIKAKESHRSENIELLESVPSGTYYYATLPGDIPGFDPVPACYEKVAPATYRKK
ncbi:MAG: hypothetical protein NC187_07100 [Candidatus Amulumruptor caecigallinarius]|nr:hypothetical protein [Candidatus Amulumruptor caecigallinarius]MCM1397235.1 hypothetical protein [Candidatus Amulumruptor caecigallinarius]MCM1453091.1 hypothetical protein [bacterium]